MVGDLGGRDIATGVGITALVIAAGRAIETNRANGLVRDPFAEAFLKEADVAVPMPTRLDEVTGSASAFEQLWDAVARVVGVRSRYFDEVFADSWTANVRQAVLLGAGLDTRAFRLDWPPGCTLFEIDQPHVLDFKNRVLGTQRAHPQCTRKIVAIDLRENWCDALLAAGFDVSQPTTWLMEGLLSYLPEPTERQLCDTIHRLSGPGSRVAVDRFKDASTVHDSARDAIEQIGFDLSALVAAKPESDTVAYMAAHGWTGEGISVAELVERYQSRISPLVSPELAERMRYYLLDLKPP